MSRDGFQAQRLQLGSQHPEPALAGTNSTRTAKLPSERVFSVLLRQDERAGAAGPSPVFRVPLCGWLRGKN